MEFDNEFHAVG